MENGIAERLAQRWIGEHGEDYVAEKLDFVEAERRKGRVRKTPAGYLAAAIKGDFKPSAAPVQLVPAPGPKSPTEAELAEQARDAELVRDAAWRKACLEVIDANLEKRSPASRKAVKDRFERQLEDEFERGQFRRYGWHARGGVPKVRDFWSGLVPEGLPERGE